MSSPADRAPVAPSRRRPDASPGRVARPRVVRSRLVHAPAPLVWSLVGNLHRHEELIPLTRIDAPDRVTRTGDMIVARSAVVLVDRMVTTNVQSAGGTATGSGWGRWATFAKVGPVLLGEAHLVVRARGHHQCLVVWAEDVRLARDAPVLGVPLDLSLVLMSDLALRRLARAVEAL